MKVGLPITIVTVLILAGGILFVSKNGNHTQGMHMMNGQMMSNNDMHNTNKPVQSQRTYSMKITSNTSSIQSNQSTTFVYKIVDEQGNELKDFELDHTKLMHFIVVRKDLQDFQHVHPDFNKDTGEFTIPVTFPENGNYRLFADFSPVNVQKDSMGMPLAVVDYQNVNVGDVSQYTPQDVVPETDTTKTVDGYQIEYTIPQQIQSGQEAKITLHVTKDGQPITDMEEYLGAQAHGILLQKDTLNFAHIHAMGNTMTHMMGGKMMTMQMGENKGPDINFTYTFPSSGVYKLFTQFQHHGRVITTNYVVNVK